MKEGDVTCENVHIAHNHFHPDILLKFAACRMKEGNEKSPLWKKLDRETANSINLTSLDMFMKEFMLVLNQSSKDIGVYLISKGIERYLTALDVATTNPVALTPEEKVLMSSPLPTMTAPKHVRVLKIIREFG